jgi:type IV pilus assembly protein PilB
MAGGIAPAVDDPSTISPSVGGPHGRQAASVMMGDALQERAAPVDLGVARYYRWKMMNEAAGTQEAGVEVEPERTAGETDARADRLVVVDRDAEPFEGRMRLGALFIRDGFLSADGLERALFEKEQSDKPLGEILVGLGLITHEILARALAEQFDLDYIDLSLAEIDGKATMLLPERIARRYQALPVSFLDEATVLVAVVDPTNLLIHDDLRFALGVDIRFAVAPSDQLEHAIGRAYLPPLKVDHMLSEVQEAEDRDPEDQDSVSDIRGVSADLAPAIRAANEVIGRALDLGASDLHFEPQADRLVVRVRVDGVTRELATMPRSVQPAVIARLKVMGGLDIAQHRAPQDGRAAIRVAGRPMDLRMALLPTTHGERVAIRILNRTVEGPLDLAALGMDATTEGIFRHAIAQPYGAIIACGPTGSGKTTTLYAALDLLNDAGRVLVTIEDPVEYQMSGVSQMEIDPLGGLTFARGLRTILRSDPDVMLVGEIRDEETARIAMQAATTGHLVLTTLHTHNAANSIIRLKDMGIEPELLATSINCIVAQRLARRLCHACREPYTPTEEQRVEFGLTDHDPDLQLYRARGCNDCFETGFRGRVALYEAMPLTSNIRRLIGASTEDISAAAVEEGMTTLHESGLRLCLDGITSPEEIRRVTGDRQLNQRPGNAGRPAVP